jgi:hypothetical protein
MPLGVGREGVGFGRSNATSIGGSYVELLGKLEYRLVLRQSLLNISS